METKFIRDKVNPKALINTDRDALNAIRLQKKLIQKKKSIEEERISKLEQTVEKLKLIVFELTGKNVDVL